MDTPCNCRKGGLCPVDDKCGGSNVIYRTAMTLKRTRTLTISIVVYPGENERRNCIIISTHFKKKKLHFTKKFCIWRRKTKNPQMDWKIIWFSHTANSFKGRFNLCLHQKIRIIKYENQKTLLNQRNELNSECRHRSRLKQNSTHIKPVWNITIGGHLDGNFCSAPVTTELDWTVITWQIKKLLSILYYRTQRTSPPLLIYH